MAIGVDISSLGYDVAQDRYYVYATGKVFDSLLNKDVSKNMRNGYESIPIYSIKRKNTRQEYVHRLVGKAFVSNPNSLSCINHKDGNKLNNLATNLEWCGKGDNNKHAYRTGLRANGRGGGHNTPIICTEMGEVFKSVTQASEKCGIGRRAIQECLSGRNKTCAGMHWKYIK